jgi:hypothetical protein
VGELLGYARVSTLEQDAALQHDALSAAGCFRLWTDIVSGSLTDRPELTVALDALRPGGTLVVWRLDRLGGRCCTSSRPFGVSRSGGSGSGRCRRPLTALIASVSHGVPIALTELRTLGRTLTKRAEDVLAYFDRPGTSNGPTEAMNSRLEHLRGSALGFRNLTNYIARSLLETGGFRPRLHPQLR